MQPKPDRWKTVLEEPTCCFCWKWSRKGCRCQSAVPLFGTPTLSPQHRMPHTGFTVLLRFL